ncbi:MAG: hypothetical protein QNJ54_04205 [Prochloraceae cyanobacterium]|nr:hypothetical protein [Prochloraceae cyanobacterium]
MILRFLPNFLARSSVSSTAVIKILGELFGEGMLLATPKLNVR